MDLPQLTEGILIKRYKRFLADVDFGDRIEIVHCPNPGAMTGLKTPGSRVWCSLSDNPKRKLPYTIELIEADHTLVGINTNRPNAIAHEALAHGVIPDFQSYQTIQREYTWKKRTRFDFRLDDATDNSPAMLLEIKNVHLRRSDADELIRLLFRIRLRHAAPNICKSLSQQKQTAGARRYYLLYKEQIVTVWS